MHGMQGDGMQGGGGAGTKAHWIEELVRAEQEMEEAGVIDVSAGFDPDRALLTETIFFMNDLKAAFIEAASTFNNLKSSHLGQVKIYTVSKTHADFMLFRNGFKLIFTMKYPGTVAIRFQAMTPNFLPGEGASAEMFHRPYPEEDLIQSQWGAFAEILWTYRDQSVRIDSMVRHYMTRFIRESAK